MPDGRPALTEDEELARERARFVAMLEEGLTSIRAGEIVTPDELDAMLDDAFARQDEELGGKR